MSNRALTNWASRAFACSTLSFDWLISSRPILVYKGIQRGSRPFERVRKQMPVGLVDLVDARSHEAGELEERDAAAMEKVANECRRA